MRPRARGLGIPFDGLPGPGNAITDVPGIAVGMTTLIRRAAAAQPQQIQTGVTAILPRGFSKPVTPVWAGQFTLNGNGEMTGTHWLNDAGYFSGPVILTNTHAVGIAHHAAASWMIEHYAEYFQNHHAWAMPVVAETYDGILNDICGQHVTAEHVLAAIRTATTDAPAEGNVGGGTGMQTYEFKGGTGTSSRRVDLAGNQYMVGALVQSNFGVRHELAIAGVPVGQHLADNALLTELGGTEHGSIIVIIATDAPLSPVQLQRLARRGALGIGRTGTSGGHFSGDLMLAFSTANPVYQGAIGEAQPLLWSVGFLNDAHCDSFHAAAVQAVEEAVVNALVAAESVPTFKPPGHVLSAIDHEALRDVLRRFGRLR
ncbi:MAG: P1 family peptidase [Steroidobacteraceae bacterium]